MSEATARLTSIQEAIQAYTGMPYTSVSDSQTAASATPTSVVGKFFDQILVKKRGSPYSEVASWSHYNDPLSSAEPYRGNSRIWGDASLDVQERIIEDFVKFCTKPFIRTYSSNPSKRGNSEVLNVNFMSLCLSIMRTESGYNLDAAAGTTSACGLGQFLIGTDKNPGTGRYYGLNESNLWDFSAQVRAFVCLTLDNRDYAEKSGRNSSWIYAYHHDGTPVENRARAGTTKAGDIGLSISESEVMPKIPAIVALGNNFLESLA